MKGGLIVTALLLLLLCGNTLNAQTFSLASHTATLNLGGNNAGEGTVAISVPGAGALTIARRVVNSSFPTDWLKQNDFGLCVDEDCEINIGNTYLWDKTNNTGTTVTFNYSKSIGMLGLALNNMRGKTEGCYFVAVEFKDMATGGSKDTVTYIACRSTLAAPIPVSNEPELLLFPNPASGELNIAYDTYADIRIAAVCDVTGKLINTYKVSGGNAKLNVGNIPAGIYLMKLYNGNGNAVVTRKFTKQ